MSFSIRRWGVGHVMGAWAGYWIAWLALRPARADIDAPRASASSEALPDGARGGWPQPITPTSTPSPVERRDQRGS